MEPYKCCLLNLPGFLPRRAVSTSKRSVFIYNDGGGVGHVRTAGGRRVRRQRVPHAGRGVARVVVAVRVGGNLRCRRYLGHHAAGDGRKKIGHGGLLVLKDDGLSEVLGGIELTG